MPRFAILTHDHPFLHWDLLLEEGETLRTWRLAAPLEAGRTFAAQPLPPHRPMYLDYEGPVSGDRGTVTRWDRGTYAVVVDSPSRLVAQLAGERSRGRLTLCAPGDGSQGEGAWSASFVADDSDRSASVG